MSHGRSPTRDTPNPSNGFAAMLPLSPSQHPGATWKLTPDGVSAVGSSADRFTSPQRGSRERALPPAPGLPRRL